MKLRQLIIILPFLWWGGEARAQWTQEPASMPEQWQLTLDVIKTKAQTLMVKNNGLKDEYRQLIGQVQQLQRSINDQQNKNEQLELFLKERHGRTDQQVRIEELTQIIKTKRQEARDLEEQSGLLNRKQADLDHKIQQLKYTISDIELHQQTEDQKALASQNAAQPQEDDQLAGWRKQLEDENKQEVLLENEWRALKTGDQTQNLDVATLEEQNKQLEARLDILRLQKLRHIKRASDTVLAQANESRYDQLKRRKDQLEANISAYESRLDDLRESSLVVLSWPLKKKKLVHEMVQMDARNNQMRDKIKVLREDIDVLRDQVARLERRVDFARGQDTK